MRGTKRNSVVPPTGSRREGCPLHGFCQHLYGLGLQDVQWELRAILITFGINADKTREEKLHPRPEGGAEADAREPVLFLLIREEGDALVSSVMGRSELIVHHEPGGWRGAEVDVNQQVVCSRRGSTYVYLFPMA